MINESNRIILVLKMSALINEVIILKKQYEEIKLILQ